MKKTEFLTKEVLIYPLTFIPRRIFFLGLLIISAVLLGKTQDVIVFDTILSPWSNTSAVTAVDLETCSRGNSYLSDWSVYEPPNSGINDNNIFFLDATIGTDDQYYLIGQDELSLADESLLSVGQDMLSVTLGYPRHDLILAAPYGVEVNPLGIASDYEAGYVVGDGLSRYDFTNQQLTYLQNLPVGYQAGAQMAFHQGSFYYPNRSKELVQLKIRDSGVFYRIVGALPDTINYGGLFAIPHSCDSTGLFIINNNTNQTSTFYRINLRDFELEEFCLYDGRTDPGPGGGKGNALSAVYLNETDFHPCDLLLDLQVNVDSTIHLYYEICGGSLSLLQDSFFLNPYQEFDSILVEIMNPLDGNQESLSSSSFQEIDLDDTNSQHLVFRSLGFAETEHYLSALSDLVYHNNETIPTSGIRTIRITAYHPYHGEIAAEIFIDINEDNHAILANEILNSPTCYGENTGSIQIAPDGGQEPYQILWEDASSQESIDELISGNYSLTITDDFSCEETFTLPLSQPDSLIATITSLSDSICGQIGVLNSNIEGGTIPYSFNWNDNSTDSIATGLMAGLHHLTITDANNCTDTASYILIEVDTIFASEILESCQGQPILLNGQTYEQDAVFQTLLSTSDGCDSLVDYQLIFYDTFYNANSYTLCAGQSIEINGVTYDTDTNLLLTFPTINGCDSTEYHQIEVLPENTQLQTQDICEGDVFDFNDQLISQSGLYTDTLVAISGCDSILQLQLTVHSLPQPVIQITGSLCTSENVTLSSLGYNSYLWGNGEVSPEIQISASGNYSLSVTDEFGCAGETMITIVDSTLVVDYHIEQPLCPDEGGRIIFDAFSGGSPPYTALETSNTVEVFSVIDNLNIGLHTFTIQDIEGCESEITANISSGVSLEVILPDMLSINLGESILLEPILSFTPTLISWSPPLDLSCTDCLTPLASPKETITYNLLLESGEGCMWEGDIPVFVKVNGLYIPNAFSPNDDGTNDTFSISSSTSVQSINRIQIYNRWGGMVFESNSNLDQWDGMIAGQQAPQGIYLYTIEWVDLNGRIVVDKGELMLLR